MKNYINEFNPGKINEGGAEDRHGNLSRGDSTMSVMTMGTRKDKSPVHVMMANFKNKLRSTFLNIRMNTYPYIKDERELYSYAVPEGDPILFKTQDNYIIKAEVISDDDDMELQVVDSASPEYGPGTQLVVSKAELINMINSISIENHGVELVTNLPKALEKSLNDKKYPFPSSLPMDQFVDPDGIFFQIVLAYGDAEGLINNINNAYQQMSDIKVTEENALAVYTITYQAAPDVIKKNPDLDALFKRILDTIQNIIDNERKASTLKATKESTIKNVPVKSNESIIYEAKAKDENPKEPIDDKKTEAAPAQSEVKPAQKEDEQKVSQVQAQAIPQPQSQPQSQPEIKTNKDAVAQTQPIESPEQSTEETSAETADMFIELMNDEFTKVQALMSKRIYDLNNKKTIDKFVLPENKREAFIAKTDDNIRYISTLDNNDGDFGIALLFTTRPAPRKISVEGEYDTTTQTVQNWINPFDVFNHLMAFIAPRLQSGDQKTRQAARKVINGLGDKMKSFVKSEIPGVEVSDKRMGERTVIFEPGTNLSKIDSVSQTELTKINKGLITMIENHIMAGLGLKLKSKASDKFEPNALPGAAVGSKLTKDFTHKNESRTLFGINYIPPFLKYVHESIQEEDTEIQKTDVDAIKSAQNIHSDDVDKIRKSVERYLHEAPDKPSETVETDVRSINIVQSIIAALESLRKQSPKDRYSTYVSILSKLAELSTFNIPMEDYPKLISAVHALDSEDLATLFMDIYEAILKINVMFKNSIQKLDEYADSVETLRDATLGKNTNALAVAVDNMLKEYGKMPGLVSQIEHIFSGGIFGNIKFASALKSIANSIYDSYTTLKKTTTVLKHIDEIGLAPYLIDDKITDPIKSENLRARYIEYLTKVFSTENFDILSAIEALNKAGYDRPAKQIMRNAIDAAGLSLPKIDIKQYVHFLIQDEQLLANALENNLNIDDIKSVLGKHIDMDIALEQPVKGKTVKDDAYIWQHGLKFKGARYPEKAPQELQEEKYIINPYNEGIIPNLEDDEMDFDISAIGKSKKQEPAQSSKPEISNVPITKDDLSKRPTEKRLETLRKKREDFVEQPAQGTKPVTKSLSPEDIKKKADKQKSEVKNIGVDLLNALRDSNFMSRKGDIEATPGQVKKIRNLFMQLNKFYKSEYIDQPTRESILQLYDIVITRIKESHVVRALLGHIFYKNQNAKEFLAGVPEQVKQKMEDIKSANGFEGNIKMPDNLEKRISKKLGGAETSIEPEKSSRYETGVPVGQPAFMPMIADDGTGNIFRYEVADKQEEDRVYSIIAKFSLHPLTGSTTGSVKKSTAVHAGITFDKDGDDTFSVQRFIHKDTQMQKIADPMPNVSIMALADMVNRYKKYIINPSDISDGANITAILNSGDIKSIEFMFEPSCDLYYDKNIKSGEPTQIENVDVKIGASWHPEDQAELCIKLLNPTLDDSQIHNGLVEIIKDIVTNMWYHALSTHKAHHMLGVNKGVYRKVENEDGSTRVQDLPGGETKISDASKEWVTWGRYIRSTYGPSKEITGSEQPQSQAQIQLDDETKLQNAINFAKSKFGAFKPTVSSAMIPMESDSNTEEENKEARELRAEIEQKQSAERQAYLNSIRDFVEKETGKELSDEELEEIVSDIDVQAKKESEQRQKIKAEVENELRGKSKTDILKEVDRRIRKMNAPTVGSGWAEEQVQEGRYVMPFNPLVRS